MKWKLDPQSIFHENRIVQYLGRYYRVMWCDGEKVGLTAGQGPYQCSYEYLSGMFDYNHLVISVKSVFLTAM